MPTECSPTLFEFAPVEGRRVMAAFDGGALTSDAGRLLLGETDRAIRLTARLAACPMPLADFSFNRCDLLLQRVKLIDEQPALMAKGDSYRRASVA